MPGPHSHTNPPSVFTQWSSQEELKHSSMSGEREDTFAQPTLNVVEVQGENLPHVDPVPTLACPQQGGTPTSTPTQGKQNQAQGKSSCYKGNPREKRPRGQAPPL